MKPEVGFDGKISLRQNNDYSKHTAKYKCASVASKICVLAGYSYMTPIFSWKLLRIYK
jgi:hypothetical protein